MSNNEPLWMHMAAAYAQDHTRRQAYAAEIRAVARWVELNAVAPHALIIDAPEIWHVVGLLLAEADLAEAVPP